MNATRRSLLLSLPGAMAAAAQSGQTPVVVELFTSEGCSGCPPADRLLIRLVQESPVPGAVIIGLGQHVDYWNQLGWRDRFSSAVFSERQQWYASHFHGDGPYTPQMIVDGTRQFVGSDERAALRAIAAAAHLPKLPVTLTWETELSVRIEPGGRRCNVMLAITETNLENDVLRGENKGRKMRHTGVVRGWTSLGAWDGRAAFTSSGRFNVDPSWKRADLTAVVFAQDQSNRRILAVGAAAVRDA